MIKRIIIAAIMVAFLFVSVGFTTNAEEYPEESPSEYTDETQEYEPEVEEDEPEPAEYEPAAIQEWESFPIDLELNPPSGVATVADESNSSHGTDFFTIMTEAGNTFYLIIDRRHGQENVFFLNAVTEEDLIALTSGQLTIGDPLAPSYPTPEQPVFPPNGEGVYGYTPDYETTSDASIESNITHFIIIGLIVIGFGIGGWYFKIHKPKKARLSITEYEDESPADLDYDTWEDDDLEDEDV